MSGEKVEGTVGVLRGAVCGVGSRFDGTASTEVDAASLRGALPV